MCVIFICLLPIVSLLFYFHITFLIDFVFSAFLFLLTSFFCWMLFFTRFFIFGCMIFLFDDNLECKFFVAFYLATFPSFFIDFIFGENYPFNSAFFVLSSCYSLFLCLNNFALPTRKVIKYYECFLHFCRCILLFL